MIAKGQKISDRYQIIKSIGEGGMANVFLAFDTILERNVAVKVLRGDLANDEKFVRRFQREALSASSLSNDNIVEVYDVGEDNGEYYIVMEYVEGKHLKNLLKRRGKLTIPEVVDIMQQVTNGLSFAHDQYLIHRDIKPQNIMILENGLVKLTDFGIAVAMNSTQLTQTNSVMGSVHYLPPEQASGKGATLQSDIYSLGILMYELLTGKLPFKGDNAVEIALKHMKEKMPSIREEMPDIPNSIENIILRATAKNPKNRYSDAREMHDDLMTCLEESRKNELKIEYKYPETDFDDTKILKFKKDPSELTKKESEEVISKMITESDLKNQNKTLMTLLSIFTGIVVLITTIVLLLPVITRTKQVKVPDVTKMDVASATDKLQRKGFEIKDTITETSDKIAEGKVTRTNPPKNSRRKKGSDITIYVSSGKGEVVIEDYKGKNADRISGNLEGKGLKVLIEEIEVDKEEEAKYEDGMIIDQSVEPGKSLSKGETITLYIPNIKNKYPDLTTFSASEIFDFCHEHKITCRFQQIDGEVIEYDSESIYDLDSYKVLSQSRSKDTRITEGTTLTIKLDYLEKSKIDDTADSGLDD